MPDCNSIFIQRAMLLLATCHSVILFSRLLCISNDDVHTQRRIGCSAGALHILSMSSADSSTLLYTLIILFYAAVSTNKIAHRRRRHHSSRQNKGIHEPAYEPAAAAAEGNTSSKRNSIPACNHGRVRQ